jgi:hypothetical protein
MTIASLRVVIITILFKLIAITRLIVAETVIAIKIETRLTASVPFPAATPATTGLIVSYETVVVRGHKTKSFWSRGITIVVVPTGRETGKIDG